MVALVGVGGPGPRIAPSWNFWLPAYMFLSFLLLVFVVHVRVGAWAGVGAFVCGTLWAWADDPLGVLPAGALGVLVALLASAVVRRIAPLGRR